MERRTEILNAKFTEREAKMIKRVAASQGFGPSEYVRAAVMIAAVMDGDAEALKLTAELAKDKFSKWRQAAFGKVEAVPA